MAAAAKLTPTQIEMALKQYPGWKMNSAAEIEKSFELTGFAQSLIFVNAVGLLAESQDHHPDILIQWNKVKLTLSTHDSGGVTQKDFDLAQSIDQLVLI